MAELELRLLGRFELVHDPRGPLHVPPGRLRALLARLAFRPGRSRTRGDLAGLLWSGRPEPAARHSLNQALSHLRRIVGHELLVQDGEQLALNSDMLSSDVDEVRRLVRNGSTEALGHAADLCRGPFLEGIDLDAQEFEDWLRAARAEVNALVIELHEALLDTPPVSDDPARKSAIADCLVEADPLNERGHRTLIEAAAKRGDVERALKIYEGFRSRLADELGIAPEDETERLVKGLRQRRVKVMEASREQSAHSPMAGRPTVFVAPFRPLTEGAHALTVADGVTHDLITELGRFRSLDVIAAESALACRDTALPLEAMCERFAADYVLTGGLRCNATSARLNVQLLNGQGDRQLWAEHYDAALGELFDVRDEVIATIVGTAANQVEHDRMRRVRRKPTRSWDAYDHFLRGLEIYYGRWSAPDPPRVCKPLFERAIALDPDFARAHAFLACVNAHMGQTERIDEDYGASIDYARRAMAIDPLEADAPRILGAIYVTVGHHEEAYRYFAHALRLNPGHADLSAHMSRYHSLTGEPDRALGEVDRARRLNPLHHDWYWSVAAMAHHAAEDYPRALAAIRRMRETTAVERLYAAACHAAMGETECARDNVRRALADTPGLDLRNIGLYLPYKDIAKREQILDQLARAGLPDTHT